jgi:CRP-like cAMP-binding protein
VDADAEVCGDRDRHRGWFHESGHPAPRRAARVATRAERRDEAQIHQIAAHGRRRQTTKGEVLVEIGDTAPFFVVVRGAIQVLSPTAGAETVIVTHGPGQFTGEANMMTGRRSIARSRVSEDGEVIQLDRSALLALIQTDAELSAILMRAFILRRAELRDSIADIGRSPRHQGVNPSTQSRSHKNLAHSVSAKASKRCSRSSLLAGPVCRSGCQSQVPASL